MLYNSHGRVQTLGSWAKDAVRIDAFRAGYLDRMLDQPFRYSIANANDSIFYTYGRHFGSWCIRRNLRIISDPVWRRDQNVVFAIILAAKDNAFA